VEEYVEQDRTVICIIEEIDLAPKSILNKLLERIPHLIFIGTTNLLNLSSSSILNTGIGDPQLIVFEPIENAQISQFIEDSSYPTYSLLRSAISNESQLKNASQFLTRKTCNVANGDLRKVIEYLRNFHSSFAAHVRIEKEKNSEVEIKTKDVLKVGQEVGKRFSGYGFGSEGDSIPYWGKIVLSCVYIGVKKRPNYSTSSSTSTLDKAVVGDWIWLGMDEISAIMDSVFDQVRVFHSSSAFFLCCFVCFYILFLNQLDLPLSISNHEIERQVDLLSDMGFATKEQTTWGSNKKFCFKNLNLVPQLKDQDGESILERIRNL